MANKNDVLVGDQSVVYQNDIVSIYQPEASITRSTAYVRQGDVVQFNFDIKSARVEVVNGDLHLIFANGATITLLSLVTMGFSDSAPLLRDIQGNLMTVAEFLNKAYSLIYTEAYLILTNKDDYAMSPERPDVVKSASDNTASLDGGNPISGAGLSDVALIGALSNQPSKGLINGNLANTGKGFFPTTNYTSDLPFLQSSTSSQIGSLNPDTRPTLDYRVFYGIDINSRPAISLSDNNILPANSVTTTYGRNYALSQGLKDTTDKTTLLASAELNFSTVTENILFVAAVEFMVYIFEVNYINGIAPNFMAIRFSNPAFIVEGDVKFKDGAYIFDSVSPSGSMLFSVKFPYGTPPQNLDITYDITYIDTTGELKPTSYVQSVKVRTVSKDEDLGAIDDIILSNGAPGVKASTGTGNDIIFGGYGDNDINSGDGTDSVFSGLGNDKIDLGAGDDFYWGSLGVDLIQGGSGVDTVYYNNFANKQPTRNAAGVIQKDADGKIIYQTGNLLDATGATIKDGYYNSYISSTALTILVGKSNMAAMLNIKALQDRYGTFDVTPYLNNNSILVTKEGSLLGGVTNIFDLLSGVESVVGVNYLSDTLSFSYNAGTKYSALSFYAGLINANSKDTIIIDSAGTIPGHVVINLMMSETAQYIEVGFSDTTVGPVNANGSSKIYGFNRIKGSDEEETFVGGLGFNKIEGKDYSVSGTGADIDYKATGFGEDYLISGGSGKDTLDYSKDSRILNISFNANAGRITKYYEVLATRASDGASKNIIHYQTDILTYAKANGVDDAIENIIGTNGADTYLGSVRNHYNYQSDFTNTGAEDSLSYMGQSGTGLTLVINADGSKTAYKAVLGELNNVADYQTFLTSNAGGRDHIGTNIKITLTGNSDVIVSEETGSYKFITSVNAGYANSTRDYVSYINMTSGITVNVAAAGLVTVIKGGGGEDTFNFYNTTTKETEIYGIYGTAFNDVFNMHNGAVGETHYIYGGGGNNTLNYGTPGAVNPITVFLGDSSVVDKSAGGKDFFKQIANLIGTAGNDRVNITQTATAASMAGLSIDLGMGTDIIDFSSASTALLGGTGITVTFFGIGAMRVSINANPLNFLNVEGVVGTNYNDTFIIPDFLSMSLLSFNGYGGLYDTIDYSAMTVNLTFDVGAKQVVKTTIIGSTTGNASDKIVDIEVFIGGTGTNTFKSILEGNFSFNGSAGFAAGTIQTVDYSNITSGVVFDFSTSATKLNPIAYKVGYDSRAYLDAVANNTLGNLRQDNFTGINNTIGSAGSDAFIIDVATATAATAAGAGFVFNGGGGSYNIIDLSDFANAVTLTLLDSISYVLNITGLDGTFNLSVTNIAGIKGTKAADKVTLDGFRTYYFDGNEGYDTVSYNTTNASGGPAFVVPPGRAIVVKIGQNQLDVSKSYLVGTAVQVKQDILKNIEEIDLSTGDDEVALNSWNMSVQLIDGSAGNDLINLKSFVSMSATVITATLGRAQNTVTLTNSTAAGSIDLMFFEALYGSQNSNVVVSIVIDALLYVDSGFQLLGQPNLNSQTNLSFNSANFTNGVILNLNYAIGNDNASITAGGAGGVSRTFGIRDISNINLTAANDTVYGSQLQSIKFNGNGGVDTLSYEKSNGGSIFYWEMVGSELIGYAGKNRASGPNPEPGSVRDSFVGFTNVVGSTFADTVVIGNLSTILSLTLNPSFALNMFGASFGSDTIKLDFATVLDFNLSTSSITTGGVTVNIGWVSSVNAAGVAQELILQFGVANDIVRYNGTTSGSYTVIDGAGGDNSLESSSAMAFDAKTAKLAATVADLANPTAVSLLRFKNIRSTVVGGNTFLGTNTVAVIDYGGINYFGAGLAGANIDTLSYKSSVVAMTFNLTSARGGNVVLSASAADTNAVRDSFTDIFSLVGSDGGNTFIIQNAALGILNNLQITGGLLQDSLYLNLTNSASVSITSSSLSVTSGGATSTLGSFSVNNSIETIQLNTATVDTVTIGANVDFSMFIKGSGEDEDDSNRRDTLAYSSGVTINSANTSLINTFDVLTGTITNPTLYSLIFDSTRDIVERQVGTTLRSDSIKGFSEIRHDAATGKMLAIAFVRDYTYTGSLQADGYSLHVDYSRANFTGPLIFNFNTFTNITVTKPITGGAISRDTLNNAGYVLGSVGDDVFVLTSRPVGSTNIVTVDGGTGNNSISLDRVRSSLTTVGGPGVAGSVGNEYILDVNDAAVLASTLGFVLLNITSYGVTNLSDVFRASAVRLSPVSINGLDGIDLLDYSRVAAHFNIRVDFTIGRISMYQYVGTNLIDGVSDQITNFERALSSGGDDAFIVNENQVFLDKTRDFTLSSTAYLFDGGAGYNSLDLSAINAEDYQINTVFSRVGINDELTIRATNNTSNFTNTSTSKGFAAVNVGNGNLVYNYDAAHLTGVAYGNINPATPLVFEGKYKFTSEGSRFDARSGEVIDSVFTFNNATQIRVFIELRSLFRGMVVYDLDATLGGSSFMNLDGFNRVVIGGANILNLKTFAETPMTFVGGSSGFDRADFTTSGVSGETIVDITAATGKTSTIQYITQINSSGMTLENVEQVLAATGTNTTVRIFERIGFNNVIGDYAITIEAGAGRTNTVSFENFMSAVTSFNVTGYVLVNFTNYKLTNLADSFVLDDSNSYVVDALGNANYATVKDRVSFANAAAVQYTNGISLLQTNNIMYVNKTNAAATSRQDVLRNFEIFDLTANADSFSLTNSNEIGLVHLRYTEINFGDGSDRADLSNFDDSSLSKTNVNYTGSTFSVDLISTAATVDTVFSTYLLTDLETLILRDNNTINMSGYFTNLAIFASGLNNIFNYDDSGATVPGNAAYVFTNLPGGVNLSAVSGTTTIISSLMVNLNGIVVFDKITTNRLVRFDGFVDFGKAFTLIGTYDSAAVRTVANYSGFLLNALTFEINASRVEISNPLSAGVTHTTNAHNIILGARDGSVNISNIYTQDGGASLNVGSIISNNNSTVTVTYDNSVTNYFKIFNTGSVAISTIFAASLVDETSGDVAFRDVLNGTQFYYENRTNPAAVAKVGNDINLYGIRNFVDMSGRVVVNLGTTAAIADGSYTVGGTNNWFKVSGTIASDINLDLTNGLLSYVAGSGSARRINIGLSGFDNFIYSGTTTTHGFNVLLNNAYLVNTFTGATANTVMNITGSIAIASNAITFVDGVTIDFRGIADSVIGSFRVPVGSAAGRFNLTNFNSFSFSANQDLIRVGYEYLASSIVLDGNGGGDQLAFDSSTAVSTTAALNGLAMQFLGATGATTDAVYIGRQNAGAGAYSIVGADYLTTRNFDTINILPFTGTANLSHNVHIAFSTAYAGNVNTINVNIANPNNAYITSFSILDGIIGAPQGNTSGRYQSNISSVLTFDNRGQSVVSFGGKYVNLTGFNQFHLTSYSDAIFNIYNNTGAAGNNFNQVSINPTGGARLDYNGLFTYNVNTAGGFTNTNKPAGIVLNIGNASSVASTDGNYGSFASFVYNNLIANNQVFSTYQNGFNKYSFTINPNLIDSALVRATGTHSEYFINTATGGNLPGSLGYAAGAMILSGLNVVFASPAYTASSGDTVSFYSFSSTVPTASSFYLTESIGRTQIVSVGKIIVNGTQTVITDLMINNLANPGAINYTVDLANFANLYFGFSPNYAGGLNERGAFIADVLIADFNIPYDVRYNAAGRDFSATNVYAGTPASMNNILALRGRVNSLDLSTISTFALGDSVTFAFSKFGGSTVAVVSSTVSAHTITATNFDRFVGISGRASIFDLRGLQASDLTNINAPIFIDGGGGGGLIGSIVQGANVLLLNGLFPFSGAPAGDNNLFFSGVFNIISPTNAPYTGISALQAGNATTGQSFVVMFENINIIRFTGTTRMTLSNGLGVREIIADLSYDDEFTIDTIPPQIVLDGNGGADVYDLATDISYVLKAGNTVIIGGITYITNGYYLELTDIYGSVGYVLNINDASIKQNDVNIVLSDLILALANPSASTMYASAALRKLMVEGDDSITEIFKDDTNDTLEVAVTIEPEGLVEEVVENVVDGINLEVEGIEIINAEAEVEIDLSVLANVNDASNVQSLDSYTSSDLAMAFTEEVDLDNLLEGLESYSVTNESFTIDNDILVNMDESILLETNEDTSTDHNSKDEDKSDSITEIMKALNKNSNNFNA